ncbi:signal transduction histidine kinase [Lachnospiraceae bacterium PF1-21]|uniref:histidine kinase n=1 Tax=Ohessyouella blattaphilus TaxID=2949333 RepID=A0ABT1EJH0_9FIRM|nr:HAMP domain-containing sensor histidine kinase [Ohessyouella blattaphilus]MCP1110849.1 HAMP domain-containing histidine kinase [Ohessyouella blattaphilus]MCR8564243.1 HAMP domain-containing histidine kinase [Ohessyouella blattaphilus]MDL2250195.1 HAMP domain-containing histidine kinase [Lachnospiraceae bacterium OttesenSCG-928-J05]
MKNRDKYRKLKFSILLQTLMAATLTVLVAGFLMEILAGGKISNSLTEMFDKILVRFSADGTATELYEKLIVANKEFFLLIGFLILFAIFFNVALSKMIMYLMQVEHGIEHVVEDSAVPIRLTTELKPIEVRLNEIKATIKRQEIEAEKEEKSRNDLMLFLAHDLKTPLTSVLAYLSLLESNPELTGEEREKYTKIALAKAQRLEELFIEFFEVTKLNLQEMELVMVPVNLSLMLEQLADELYAVLKDRHLQCEVEVEDNLIIQADPDKLIRVFDNILRNAIAYCYDNSTIIIHARRKRGNVEITFSNQGDPIPPVMLQTIFEKFYRVDNARSSKTGGAGLGLAIAKDIVEMHHGTIRAKSDDFWTQFIVSLPLESEEEESK